MIKTLLLLISITCCATAQAEDPLDDIKRCAQITNAEQRLVCYDNVATAVAPASQAEVAATVENKSEPAPAPESEQSASNSDKPDTLPDSLGGGGFADAAGKVEKSYRGHVTSCKKTADRRWFYIFENGQVWKQVDRRKRRHKECDFKVTLTEDTFGYVMQIDGQKGSIRVDRRR